MKRVLSESWLDVIDALVVHHQITTNTEEYDDPHEIMEVVGSFLGDSEYEHLSHLRLTAEKDMDRSSYKNPWYILRLVPIEAKTNMEAKGLLESEY